MAKVEIQTAAHTRIRIVAFLQVQKCGAATQRAAQECCLTDSLVPRAKVKYTTKGLAEYEWRA